MQLCHRGGPHCVDQAGFKLVLILLPLARECWGHSLHTQLQYCVRFSPCPLSLSVLPTFVFSLILVLKQVFVASEFSDSFSSVVLNLPKVATF